MHPPRNRHPYLGASVLLALGGRGGDQRKPARMAGLADWQRHGHPPDLIAQRPAGLLLVQGDRDRRAQQQVPDGFAVGRQQIAGHYPARP